MFKIELKKIVYQKKLYGVFLVSIAVVLTFFFLNNLKQQYSASQRAQTYEKFGKLIAEEMRNISSSDYLLDEEKENTISDMIEQQDTIFKLQQAAVVGNWQQELLGLNSMDEKLLEARKQLNYDHLIEKELAAESPEVRIAFRNYLIEHNVKPNFVATSVQAIPFLVTFCKNLLPFLLPLLAICICMLSVHNEYAEKTGKFIFQMPCSRSRILITKLVSSFLVTCIILILIFTASFVIPLIANGRGDFIYPVRVQAGFPFTFLLAETTYTEASSLLLFIFTMLPFSIAFYLVFSAFMFTVLQDSISVIWTLAIAMIGTIWNMIFHQVVPVFPFTVLNAYTMFTASTIFSPAILVMLLILLVAILTKLLLYCMKRKNLYL